MKKVVYYARVSTNEEGQKNALEDQIRDLEKHINETGDWILVDKYIDAGKSGTTTKNRNAYNRLFRDLLTDSFDIVIVTHLDRLMRTNLDWYLFVDRLQKEEKQLFFLLEGKFYKSDDALLTGVRALVASQFSKDLSVKINNAHKRRQKEGKPLINSRMWGYDNIDGKILINEKEAEVVRYIFQRYVDGLGFRKIEQELTQQGVINRNGKPFALTTLKRMIRNEKYKGSLVSNKKHKDFDTKKTYNNPQNEWIVHEDVVPPIVSKDLWESANNILKEKKKSYQTGEKEKIAGYFQGSYLYSGKIKCGKCGRPYWHQKYSSMKHDLWQCSGYRSYGKNHELGCDNNHIYTYILDDIVKEIIFDFWNNKESHIQKVIDVLDKILAENDYDDSIKRLSEEKLKIMMKKNNLIEAFTEQLISKNDFITKKQEFESKLSSIEEQISYYEDKNKNIVDKKRRLEGIHRILQNDIENKENLDEEIIEYFLKEISVKDNGELDIVLNGDFEYIAKKINDSNMYEIVSYSRSNRYAC